MRVLVTGGSGFIGSAMVRRLIGTTPAEVLNVDAMKPTGRLANVADVARSPRYAFMRADIGDARAMADILARFAPDRVFDLAAATCGESHDGDAVRARARDTGVLLRVLRDYWQHLPPPACDRFRYVQGSIEPSPAAASDERAADVAGGWYRSHGLPVVVVRSSPTYGPFQDPRRSLPRLIIAALERRTIAAAETGRESAAWLHVDDHADALLCAAERAAPGSVHYAVGPSCRSEADVAQDIRDIVGRLIPWAAADDQYGAAGRDSRPRMAVPGPAVPRLAGLDWEPRILLEEGLLRTVAWYIANRPWWSADIPPARPDAPPHLARTA